MEQKTAFQDVLEMIEVKINIIALMEEKWAGVVLMLRGMSVGKMMHLKCIAAITSNMKTH